MATHASFDSFPPHRRFRSHRSAVALLCLTATGALAGCGAGNFGLIPDSTTTPVAATNGPQLGYQWVAADKTLRPILGVPGSSQVGETAVTAGAYQSAVTAARATYAVMQATDGTLDVVTLPAGVATTLPVTVASGAVLRMSPSGAVAAVYAPGASSASIVSGLPGAPQTRVVAAGLPIADSAVSDSGSVAFETAQGSSLMVSVVGVDGRSHSVASLGAGGGLAFLPGRDDLLLLDAVANTLSLVASASTSPAPSVVMTANLLQTPAALGVSPSGRWALVANGAGKGAVRIDLAHNASVAVACTCSPTLAAPLADDGAFRVTDLASAPNWIVAGTDAAPRVLFIPPANPPKKTVPGTGAAQ